MYALATYSYDIGDRLTGMTGPDNATTSITYDLLGRKTSMNDPDMGAWSYTYDGLGNLLTQTDARGTKLWFGYDVLNRLTQKRLTDALGTPLANYTYDDTSNGNKGVGRRTGMSNPSGITSWVYDARGRLVQESKYVEGTGGGTFVTQWGYDSADRMTQMVYPGGEGVNFLYNEQGLLRRMYTTGVDYVQSAMYDAAGRVTAVMGSSTIVYVGAYYEKTTSGSSTTITKYYQAGGQRVAMRVNGVLRWLATDHLGSTALTVSESGARMSELRYKPWGESRYTFGATPTQRRFTGQVLDEVAGGLYFYNARYYDPALGRFAQADTIVPSPQNPQSLNRYSYALNNVLSYSDPSGHSPLLITAFLGGLVGGAIAYVPQVMDNLDAGMSLSDAALQEDGSKVAAGFVGGAVAGGTLGLGTVLGVGFWGTVAFGGVGGVLGGQAAAMTEGSVEQLTQWAHGQGWDNEELLQGAFNAGLMDPKTMVLDAAGGAISAGIGYGLKKVMTPTLNSFGDQVFKGGVPMIRFTPMHGELQAHIALEGRTVILSASDLENIIKAISAGTYDVASELLQQLIDAAIQQQAQQQTGQSTP